MTVKQIQQEVIARTKHINSMMGGEKDISKIATHDVASIRNAHSNEWSYVLWDRKSPINGIPAEEVLANRKDIPENGEVYLILKGEQVVIFQPHVPHVAGHPSMDSDTVHSHAQEHLDIILDEATINHIIENI